MLLIFFTHSATLSSSLIIIKVELKYIHLADVKGNHDEVKVNNEHNNFI